MRLLDDGEIPHPASLGEVEQREQTVLVVAVRKHAEQRGFVAIDIAGAPAFTRRHGADVTGPNRLRDASPEHDVEGDTGGLALLLGDRDDLERGEQGGSPRRDLALREGDQLLTERLLGLDVPPAPDHLGREQFDIERPGLGIQGGEVPQNILEQPVHALRFRLRCFLTCAAHRTHGQILSSHPPSLTRGMACFEPASQNPAPRSGSPSAGRAGGDTQPDHRPCSKKTDPATDPGGHPQELSPRRGVRGGEAPRTGFGGCTPKKYSRGGPGAGSDACSTGRRRAGAPEQGHRDFAGHAGASPPWLVRDVRRCICTTGSAGQRAARGKVTGFRQRDSRASDLGDQAGFPVVDFDELG